MTNMNSIITLKDAFEDPVPWKLTRWSEPH